MAAQAPKAVAVFLVELILKFASMRQDVIKSGHLFSLLHGLVGVPNVASRCDPVMRPCLHPERPGVLPIVLF